MGDIGDLDMERGGFVKEYVLECGGLVVME